MVLSTFLSPWGFRLLDKLTGDKPQCKFMLYFGSRVKPDATIPQTWFFFKHFIYLLYIMITLSLSSDTPEEVIRLISDGCEPPCGCWDLNSGPWEEQSVLLTTEPSLQPDFFKYISQFLSPAPPPLSFIFYTCLTCVYVCVAGVCLVLEEVGRAHQILWDWSYRPSWGTMCWESKLGPLQEQVFLTTEPPPNPMSIMKS